MTTVLTIEEVVDSFSQGLPMEQRNANFDFVAQLHQRLKEGGIWMSPALGIMYKRVGDGFEIVTTELGYMDMGEPDHVG